MIHSAIPTVSPVVFSLEICFVLQDFEKWGRTDKMCENNDHYGSYCGSAEWIKRVFLRHEIKIYYSSAEKVCSVQEQNMKNRTQWVSGWRESENFVTPQLIS